MTINGKNYTMPALNFSTLAKLEKMGVNVNKSTEQPVSFLIGMIAVAAKNSFDAAAEILDEFVGAGGNIADLIEEMKEANKNSGFFGKSKTNA